MVLPKAPGSQSANRTKKEEAGILLSALLFTNSFEMPIHLFKTINLGLEIFKRRHLNHVLDARAKNHHFDPLEFAAFGSGGHTALGCFGWVANEDRLSTCLHCIERIGLEKRKSMLVDTHISQGGNVRLTKSQAPTPHKPPATRTAPLLFAFSAPE